MLNPAYARINFSRFYSPPHIPQTSTPYILMARITVEDCLQHIPSRFELVVIASRRARQIAEDSQSSEFFAQDSKPALIALKEIADSSIDIRPLYQNKEEQEKADIEDMLNRMQMIDTKLSERDELKDVSNVRLVKQDDVPVSADMEEAEAATEDLQTGQDTEENVTHVAGPTDVLHEKNNESPEASGTSGNEKEA